MKNIKVIAYYLLFTLLFQACSDDKNTYDPNSIEFPYLTFDASVVKETVTHGDVKAWLVNSKIGFFASDAKQILLANSENLQYITAKGDGYFTPANKYTQALVFPETESTLNILAYAPFMEEMKEAAYSFDLKDQSKQEQIDLMLGKTSVGKDDQRKVALDFQHMFSKLVVVIETDPSIGKLRDLKVVLTNVETEGDYYILEQNLVRKGVNQDLTLKTSTSGKYGLSQAILFPTSSDSRKITLRYSTSEGMKTFEYDLSNKAFEQGKKTMLTIKLHLQNSQTTIIEAVEPWGAGSTETVTNDPTDKPDVYEEEVLFDESFGVFGDAKPVKTIIADYLAFDMKSPVSYSSNHTSVVVDFMEDRFPDNEYYVTLGQNSGSENTAGIEKSLKISSINLKDAKDPIMTFDYAFSANEVGLESLTLKCNGKPITVNMEPTKNRDRFQPSLEISLPRGTNEIEFIKKVPTQGAMRIDNIKIKGLVLQP